MAILVACACGQRFQTPEENAGRRARCPDCGRGLVIPRARKSAVVEDRVERDSFEYPTSGKAVVSFVLGLLSIVCAFLTGLPAILVGWRALREIGQSRGLLRGRGLAASGVALGTFGSTAVTAGLLVPVVESWRETLRRAQCVDNLKQIALAMHNFHAQHNTLPPAAIVDKSGRPLLSWRVLLLPYLGPEARDLYTKFRFDEPWDGPNNSALLRSMPAVFACPDEPGLGTSQTTYQVIVGPRAVFTGTRKGTRIPQITDGTSTTLMLAESSTPVPWTAPQDLPFNMSARLSGMGSSHPGGFHAALADGSIHFLKGTINPGYLGSLITKDGGEVISLPP